MMEPDEVPSDPGTAYQLGLISGQLRELIHSTSDVAQKVEAVARRVDKLEKEDNIREGARNLFHAVLKSPLVGWVIGGAAFMWGIVTGRIHL